MDSKEKYLKYKIKYLNLKKSQKGGYYTTSEAPNEIFGFQNGEEFGLNVAPNPGNFQSTPPPNMSAPVYTPPSAPVYTPPSAPVSSQTQTVHHYYPYVPSVVKPISRQYIYDPYNPSYVEPYRPVTYSYYDNDYTPRRDSSSSTRRRSSRRKSSKKSSRKNRKGSR